MSKLLARLLGAFFRPAIDGGPPADDPQFDLLDDDPPADDPPQDPPDDDPPADAPAKLLAQEREARKADRERADRFERELAELRSAQPRQASRPDPTFEAEEAVLKDPDATPLEKWQVQANRELRAGRSEAQAAVAQARDIADRTAFSGIAMNDPTAKKYEAEVEKELARIRADGGNAGREAIYTFLLGRDMRAGKFKKAAPKKQADASSLNRGKLPGARSDVGGRNAMSEHEKRRARLENVSI